MGKAKSLHIYTEWQALMNTLAPVTAEEWGSRRLFQTHRYLKERELND